MASRSVAALFVLLLSAAQGCLAQNNKLIVSADVFAKLKALFVTQAENHISRQDMPQERPPPNSPLGYELCDYSCMTNFDSSVKTLRSTKGVLEVDVKYKPLAGITSNMLVWLFQNDHKNVTMKRADNTTRTMPMHLLFHPVDHVYHTVSGSPVAVGTTLVWCEMPLTGCAHDKLSSTQPWVCPTNRTGFLRSDPTTKWAGYMRSKSNMVVNVFNSSMMEFSALKTHPLFGGNGTRVVATTRHTWGDSPAGLQLRTQLFLGLMARGATDRFDVSLLAAPANAAIKQVYLDNAKNIPAGNITAAGHMASLHFLQEYGGLTRWLPQVYNSRQL